MIVYIGWCDGFKSVPSHCMYVQTSAGLMEGKMLLKRHKEREGGQGACDKLLITRGAMGACVLGYTMMGCADERNETK